LAQLLGRLFLTFAVGASSSLMELGPCAAGSSAPASLGSPMQFSRF
jgi:hypothetical protein